MVRAKFKVVSISNSMGGKYAPPADGNGPQVWTPCPVATIRLHPVSSGSEENKKFFAATPGGQIELSCINEEAAAQFELDGEYYVNFTKAEG